VSKYLGFAKPVTDSKEFTVINPKYLNTAKAGGISKKISP